MVRYSKKLELLNNYVELCKILLKCKSILLRKVDIDINELNKTSNLAIKLKNKYLDKIKECGMYDEAFEELKKDIDTAVYYNIYPHELSNNSLYSMNRALQAIDSFIT